MLKQFKGKASGAGTTGYPCEIKWTSSCISYTHKNSKQVTNLNIVQKSLKLLKLNVRDYLYNLGTGKDLFSHSVMSDSLRSHGLQYAGLPCPSPTPRACLMSIESVIPSNHLILYCPLLLLPSIFPSIRVFSNESVFVSGGQSIGVSASVQHQSFQWIFRTNFLLNTS